MRRAARFVILLVAGLGLLTVIAYAVLTRTTRDWFDTDMHQRSRLAVLSAQKSLLEDILRGDIAALAVVLANITRDERVLGAAACARDGTQLTATPSYPASLPCRDVLGQPPARRMGIAPDGVWSTTAELPGGPLHVSAVRLGTPENAVGYVVLAHDMSLLARRETTTRNLVLVGFLVLSLAASVITMVAARLAFRGWMADFRRALAGKPGDSRSEFRPLLTDVRELVTQLSQEREADTRVGRWSPERLHSTMVQHLQGERVVVVANREPYIHERVEGGPPRVVHPASGLVTALEPVLRACSGVWVAHGSGSADRETVDARDRVAVPPGEEAYLLRRVWLSEAEEAGYYYGFANEGMWPLCHVAHTRPVFRAEDWEQYRVVNERFAEAACQEVDVEDPIILVQDYHFALVPGMIRARLPRATILTFWHIPWPSAERFGICPWRKQILDGLLGSSIVGFHTRQHCNNFMEAADTFIEARLDREANAIVRNGRRTAVQAYPISIEWPVRWLHELPSAEQCRREILEQHDLAPDTLLGVGVDRLDYTKGIEERLLAVDQLLERYPRYRGRFVFLQLAAPSRTRIARYRELGDRVEHLVQTINARWGQDGYRPIILYQAHHEPPSVFRYLRASNVCYVSSLHDGMNLVAKEFVAARDDEQGVLMLSQFTGAARELTESLIVNPYDLEQASDAFAAALSMPPEEQRARLRSMRALVSHFNVYRWAGHMLVDAAELRRRERLTGTLARSSHPPSAAS